MPRSVDATREGTAEGFSVVLTLAVKHVPHQLHKLVLPLLLICLPVWVAAKLPVPPIPPTRPSSARVAKVPQKLPAPFPRPGASPTKVAQVPQREPHSSTQVALSRRIPIPPFPSVTAPSSQAPIPNRDQEPPADPPHTRVTPTDFRSPNIYPGAGYPYGSQYPTPEDNKPLGTPGLTVTIPLRLP